MAGPHSRHQFHRGHNDFARVSPRDYDLSLTLRQNLQYQQNRSDFPIGIAVACAP